MFKRKKSEDESVEVSNGVETIEAPSVKSSRIALVGVPELVAKEDDLPLPDLIDEFSSYAERHDFFKTDYNKTEDCLKKVDAYVAFYPQRLELDSLLDIVIQERKSRNNGYPVLVIVCHASDCTALGEWLLSRAKSDTLEGIRLVFAASAHDAVEDTVCKFTPITDPSVIAMPSAPEVENSPKNYFFALSEHMQKTVRNIEQLAENGVERLYLLGAPGSGKTTLAYYYYLKRNKGRFIAVNLNAESSGDKEAMKSLLCGHVSGAFPGASSREGAFSYSDGGVAFLDESHGVTGVVMQVLMEALDSGQYLPFGATKKRLLECAVIFASNRSWEQLRSEIDLDEHARLGATIVPVHDLIIRKEDLLVGVCIALARFKEKSKTWTTPKGITEAGLQIILSCPWRGNMRTLFRVMETALTSFGLNNDGVELLDTWELQEGINLWEPSDHHSHSKYTSYR